MVRNGHRGHASVLVETAQGNVLFLANHFESQLQESPQDLALGSVNRELAGQISTPASARNTCITGGSVSREPGPKVSA